MAANAPHNPHGSIDAHGETHGHGSMRDYLIGFFGSVALTAVPFWLVMTGTLSSRAATAAIVVALAVIQIIVHVRFFIHVDSKGEGGWTLVAFIFTAIIVVITIGGSIWAMYQMSTNMMPTSGMEAMTGMP